MPGANHPHEVPIRAQDNRIPTLSYSIYWEIWSPRSFYASALDEAVTSGAPYVDDIEEKDWPSSPQGDNNFDISTLPDWLCIILTMDNLYEWGLMGVRIRRHNAGSGNKAVAPFY